MPELISTEEPVELSAESEKHITAIMEQVQGISRAKAIAALQAHNHDVIQTIMDLTMTK